MYLNIQILFFFVFINVFSQNVSNESYYKEDQIYLGVSYISLKNNIDDLKQNGFSRSIFIGFINDISLNKKGDLALGIGLGYSNDKYISNLEYSFDNFENSFKFKVPNKKSDFKSYIKTKLNDIANFNQSINLSLGYNTWNIFVEYYMKSLIKTYDLNQLTPIKIGLIFYIL